MKFSINTFLALTGQIDSKNLHRFSGKIEKGKLAQQNKIFAAVDQILMKIFNSYGEKREQQLFDNCFRYASTHRTEGGPAAETLQKVESILSKYFNLKPSASNQALYRLMSEMRADSATELTMADFPEVPPASKGINLNQKLLDALIAGNFTEMREAVLQGAKVNKKDALGFTPLHYAVASGKTNSVYFLLQYGASPNSKDRIENLSPFDLALKNQYSLMVEIMVAAGAEINKSTLGKIKDETTRDRVASFLNKNSLQTSHKSWKSKFSHALPASWSQKERKEIARKGSEYVSNIETELPQILDKYRGENRQKKVEELNAYSRNRNRNTPNVVRNEFNTDVTRTAGTVSLPGGVTKLNTGYSQSRLLVEDALKQSCPEIPLLHLQERLTQTALSEFSAELISVTATMLGIDYMEKLPNKAHYFHCAGISTHQVIKGVGDHFTYQIQTKPLISLETGKESIYIDHLPFTIFETYAVKNGAIIDYIASVKK